MEGGIRDIPMEEDIFGFSCTETLAKDDMGHIFHHTELGIDVINSYIRFSDQLYLINWTTYLLISMNSLMLIMFLFKVLVWQIDAHAAINKNIIFLISHLDQRMVNWSKSKYNQRVLSRCIYGKKIYIKFVSFMI